MQGPLVSVIVPVYNGERYLDATLKSIFNQDYQPIEIIVVDDGSTDNTAEIVRSHQNIHCIYQDNRGPSAARNIGIAAAQGEIIAFLDADDVWVPQKLSMQVAYLTQHPDVGFVYAHRRMIIEEGVEKPPWYREQDNPGLIAGNLVARKNIFENVGFFNPEYHFGENAEWLARAKDAGIPMAILPETLLISRVHGQNLTHHSDEMRSHILKALKSSIDRQRSKGHVRKSNSTDENKACISVIIPVYNGERYLAETIDSVLAQTYQSREVILVDDGSTDGSARIAKNFGTLLQYYYQPNRGTAAAFNHGLERARGDYFAFLGADDLWTENKCELQMTAFHANPHADIVTGHVKQFYSPELDESERKKIRCTHELLPGHVIPAMLIKREAFFRVGLFEPQWVVGAEMSWYLRSMEKGLSMVMLPDLVLLRRLHKQNKGITQRSFINQRVQILKAALDRQRGKKGDTPITESLIEKKVH